VTRVAVAQIHCDAADDKGRLAVTVDAVESAASKGAELVVLPELAACGYRLNARHLALHAEAAAGDGPVLSAWRDAARRRGIAVVGGFAEATGTAIANAVAVIGPEGAMIGTYRKLHLFDAEQAVFAPGDTGLPLFDVSGVSVGVLVCYDLRFPEAARILALSGADVIAVPTAWVAGFDALIPEGPRTPHVDGVIVQANLDQVHVLVADQVGEQDGVAFLGRSLVVDPFGEVLQGPLSATEEAVVAVNLDLGANDRARHRGPGISPRENRRTDVYGELLGYRVHDTQGAR
jgi:N-carbamoylputrescine amidase